METMSLEEAKQLMTSESLDKLRTMVTKPMEIDVSQKVGNDIIMAAFCQAVMTGVIHEWALNDKLVKLLNSDTNTISSSKLNYIMDVIHAEQPSIVLEVRLYTNEMKLMKTWVLDGTQSFNHIFEYVLNEFEITPHMIRTKLTDTLKTTIVNNIGQLVSKYQSSSQEERDAITISITTIHRLVNMVDHILLAEFVTRKR